MQVEKSSKSTSYFVRKWRTDELRRSENRGGLWRKWDIKRWMTHSTHSLYFSCTTGFMGFTGVSSIWTYCIGAGFHSLRISLGFYIGAWSGVRRVLASFERNACIAITILGSNRLIELWLIDRWTLGISRHLTSGTYGVSRYRTAELQEYIKHLTIEQLVSVSK